MSEDFQHHLSEFRAFFNRDCFDQRLSDLANILDRTLPPSRHSNWAGLPKYPIYIPNEQVHNNFWLPKLPPMPPRSTNQEASESRLPPNLGDDAPLTSASARGSYVMHTSVGNISAIGGHHQSSQLGVEHVGNMNFATHAPSNNNPYQSESAEPHSTWGGPPDFPPPAPVLFRDLGSGHPVLPPISSIYNNPTLAIHNLPPLAAHSQSQPNLPVGRPPTWGAPPSNTFQRPAIMDHAHVPSSGSSYYSTSMPSYNAPATLPLSSGSLPSTDSLPTPNTFGSMHGAPWQAAVVPSDHSAPSGGGAEVPIAKPACRRPRPKMRVPAPEHEAPVLGSPIRGIGPASQPPPSTPHAEARDDIAHTPSHLGVPVPGTPATPSAGVDPQVGVNPLEGEDLTPFPRPGGDPNISPDEHNAMFQVGMTHFNKPWIQHENGMIIYYLTHWSVPRERLKIIMGPQRDKMYMELSLVVFKGTRSPGAIQTQFREIRKTFDQARLQCATKPIVKNCPY
ncbi:hypothetical protein FRC08_007550 [Ceratobasidium sp. 394]|nr:hypothetical protein FRC08_007550 [Ceratobasidium sp. 394]